MELALMPTYEYACTACGQHIEVVQSMSAEPLRECGNCGGDLRKVFSPIGIVFKGSGFYRTDSRASGAPDGKRASAKEKSDAKPDSTPSAKSGGGDSAPAGDTKSSTEKSA
jgi:putative FmdB family regulatory protein